MPEEIEKVNVCASEEGVNFELESFRDGPTKGLKFVVPAFTAIQKALEWYGEELLLAIVNSAISAQIRVRVKNSFNPPEEEDQSEVYFAELLKRNDGIVYSVDQAKSWRPGEREKTPKAYFRLAAEYYKEGKIAEALECIEKAKAIMANAA